MLVIDKLARKDTRTQDRQAEAYEVAEWAPRQLRSSGWWVPLVCGFSQAASAHSPHAHSEPRLQACCFLHVPTVVRGPFWPFKKAKHNTTKPTLKKTEKGNLPNAHRFLGATAVPMSSGELRASPTPVPVCTRAGQHCRVRADECTLEAALGSL